MDPSQKVCIIVNPTAGHGKSRKMLPEVTGLLTGKGVKFDVIPTTGPGHAEFLARELSTSEYKALVSMGGDGTLGEVVNGVMASGPNRIALATIPAGTGNDFVGGNRLFSNWPESIDAIAQPAIKQMDVMLVRDGTSRARYAINSIGVGFDAYVVKRVSELKSKRLGSISYAIEVIRGLFAFQPHDLQIVVDGLEMHVKQGWLCALTNSERLGGGMRIAPGAASDDGFLHIGYLSDTPRLSLVKLLFSVFKGQHVGKPGVHISRGCKVSIDAPGYYPCHLDGDVRDVKFPLTVELIPGAIPFLVKQ
ncbi:MAG: diacylglycerol/lipid kinase family protein [Bacillota bacterium]